MTHVHYRTECTYCKVDLGGCPCVTLNAYQQRREPCGACTQKLKLLLDAMPHPATHCCAVAPGGQGWCLKSAGHEIPDAEGKADPIHVVVLYGHFRVRWRSESKVEADP